MGAPKGLGLFVGESERDLAMSMCTRRSCSSPRKTGSPEFSRSSDTAVDRDDVEFVSVGLDTFFCWLLLFKLLMLKLPKLLFFLCLKRRLNSGGRFGLDCCCGVALELVMVEGIGGFVALPFDIALIADVAPTLLLLLFATFMASIPFVLGSGIGVLLAASFCEEE